MGIHVNISSNREDEDEDRRTTVGDVVWLIVVIILGEVIIGTVGFHVFNQLNWIDSFRNASMILPGVGEPIHTNLLYGKVWSSLYALITGFVYLVVLGLLVSQIREDSTRSDDRCNNCDSCNECDDC